MNAALPNAPLVPTGWQTIGPFFPRTFFREGDNDLTRLSAEAAPTERGERIRLIGRVLDQGAKPVVNAILEAWQADAGGRFRHPHDPEHALADPDFLGWGRAWTDAEGWYEFRTVMPGAYRDRATGPRAPHVNLALLASGVMRRLVTTVFFPDQPAANAADPVLGCVPEALRPLLVAQEAPRMEGERVFRLDLLIHGPEDRETPFFLD